MKFCSTMRRRTNELKSRFFVVDARATQAIHPSCFAIWFGMLRRTDCEISRRQFYREDRIPAPADRFRICRDRRRPVQSVR